MLKKIFIVTLAALLTIGAPNSLPVETEAGEPMDIFEHDAELIANTIYGEANGLDIYEKSMVAWCILNRVDDGRFGGDTVEEVVKAPKQFYGYRPSNPITEENLAIARDVLARHAAEPNLIGDSGRTLPKEYLYFYGDGKHNYFRTQDGVYYRFDLEDPYAI